MSSPYFGSLRELFFDCRTEQGRQEGISLARSKLRQLCEGAPKQGCEEARADFGGFGLALQVSRPGAYARDKLPPFLAHAVSVVDLGGG
jgi:hypothetical protein